MENTMIPINSRTKFSHDWSFFGKIGFSRTKDILILPEGWCIKTEEHKPYRLKAIKPDGWHNRWGSIWFSSEGCAENILLHTRYCVRRQYRDKKFVFVSVYDKKMDIPVYITNICKKGSEEAKENFKKCTEFLKSNYPDFDDPTAYWQD